MGMGDKDIIDFENVPVGQCADITGVEKDGPAAKRKGNV
jgi:hypothetical protein